MSKHPDHPVLLDASSYGMVEFCYHGFPHTPDDHYIEITLKKEDALVCLRFGRPRQLVISEYFPTQIGLYISAISADQLEDVQVEVGDYEYQSIHFFAKSVVRVR